MVQRAMKKQRAGEGGFTLIELLIVIVILGILAAIVVLAIGGLSDSSEASACTADANTIEVAQDAYYASPDPSTNEARQTYATEPQLTGARLLKKASTNWNIEAVGDNGYTLTAENADCGADRIVGTPAP